MDSGFYSEIDQGPEDSSLTKDESVCERDEFSKTFKPKKTLREHTRIQSDEKPYVCTQESCGKSFTQYSSLQKHNRTHNGEKPYMCKLCGRGFSQISNLKRHERVHNKERPFTCEDCSRSFANAPNLKQHRETHLQTETREKFQCTECDKSYNYSNSLKKHLKVHERNLTAFPNTHDTIFPISKATNFDECAPLLAIKTDFLKNEHQDVFSDDFGENQEDEISVTKAETGLKDAPNDYLQIVNQGHLHYLVNGKLRHVSGHSHMSDHDHLEEHHVELTPQNPITCKPLKEITHVSSLMWLFSQYENYIKQNQIPLTLDMIINTCNILTCSNIHQFSPFNNNYSESFICHCLSHPNPITQATSLINQNNMQNTPLKSPKEKNCFCQETLFLKHRHNDSCGHPQILHDGHIDYIVDGHLHHVHGNHCDDHGSILVLN